MTEISTHVIQKCRNFIERQCSESLHMSKNIQPNKFQIYEYLKGKTLMIIMTAIRTTEMNKASERRY